jgi:hypothetical protein
VKPGPSKAVPLFPEYELQRLVKAARRLVKVAVAAWLERAALPQVVRVGASLAFVLGCDQLIEH